MREAERSSTRPTLRAAPASPGPAASGEVALIGRTTELRQLVAALEADRAVVVTGEAGIGKTSVIEAATRATGRPARVGGAFATLSWRSYLPLERAMHRTLTGEPSAVAADVEAIVGPDILVVDDLHWADGDTLAVVEALADRVAVVGAVRTGDPAADRVLERLRAVGVVRVDLGGLRPAESTAIVAQVAGGLRDVEVERVVRQAGGNPLLLQELAARGAVSRSLAGAIVGELRRVAAAGRTALQLLAIAGHPLAAAALGRGGRLAVASGLAIELGEDLAIRHALHAQAILAELSDVDRAALHARLARLVDDPAEVADHLERAGRRALAARIARRALADGPTPGTEARLLVIASGDAGTSAAGRLRIRAIRTLMDLGDPVAAAEAAGTAPIGDPELEGLRLAYLANCSAAAGRNAEAAEALRAGLGLAVRPESEAAYELASEEAVRIVNSGGDASEAIAILDELIVRVGGLEPPWLVDALGLRATIRFLAGELPDISRIRAWIDAALQEGRLRNAWAAAHDLLNVLLAVEGPEHVLADAADLARRFDSQGAVSAAAMTRSEATLAAHLAGLPWRAIRTADENLELPVSPRVRMVTSLHRARALVAVGAFDAAGDALSALDPVVSDDFDGRGNWLAVAAELALWSGRPDRAIELATRVSTVAAPYPGNLVLPALTGCWAAVAVGSPIPPLPSVPRVAFLAGADPEYAGLVALVAGDPGAAATAFEQAATTWRPYNRPNALVCAWASGDALGASGDEPRARDRLQAVLQEAVSGGLEPLADRVRRSLRRLGIRATRRATRPDPHRLSPREREVVGLVGRGLTNLEIARRVGLGRPTVARILSNAMLKMGTDRRTQVAARGGDLS